MLLDDNGQPVVRGLHYRRLVGRSADELVGICRGVLADGVLAREEVFFLRDWMMRNAEHLQTWPFNVLFARLTAACEDGVIDHEEERELLGLLSEFTGVGGAPLEMLCDSPAPTITFEDRRFVLTGAFAVGRRADIGEWIGGQGGEVVSSVSKKADYLLLGSVGSRDWLFSNHGTKLQAAADLKMSGHHIAVVAERHALAGLVL